MSTDRNIRIEQQDARELYLLVSECRSLGGDGIAWRRHLVDGMIKLFNADMVFFLDSRIIGEPDSADGWLKPIAVVDHWPTDSSRHEFLKFMRGGRHEQTPFAHMIDGGGGFRIASRRDFCPDDDTWQKDPFFLKYFIPCNLDEFVYSVNQELDGLVQMLCVQRIMGRPPFPRKAIHLMRALWIELCRYQPHELSPVADSAFMNLPKRMLQVLSCMLAGCTAKETATQLEISVHTVQEHVKRLYKRCGATNRVELATQFRDIAPILLAVPLEDIPDPMQRIKEFTRKPWPRQPGSISQ